MANVATYGFMDMQTLFDRRVTEVGVGEVNNAIAQSMAEHQRQMDALLGLFTRRTTDFKTRFRSATVARLQPLDNNGRPRKIVPGVSYDISFPLQMGGAAWGANFVTRRKMTVGEVNDAVDALQTADMRWLRDHLLASLYANANWTVNDDQHGTLTIKGLANGDTDTYQVITGADTNATDNHYLAQAGAIADNANPYPTAWDELTEHPENGGRTAEVIHLIPTGLVATTKALATYRPIADANLNYADNVTTLAGRPSVPVPGRLLGYIDNSGYVTEWPSLPANYILTVPVGGDAPLAMREDEEADLRGFIPADERSDFPYWEQDYIRRAGFGAWNRVGAVVTRIGNAAYAVPTGYDTPMP